VNKALYRTCSGVASGAVLGNDCSLSTLPNIANAWIDPTLLKNNVVKCCKML
jgi:hypothetical protein